jgi:U3 small nucleolar RNA-associated protein 12
MKRRLKRAREKSIKKTILDTDNRSNEVLELGNFQSESVILSDILEQSSILRFSSPVRGFDFSPNPTSSGDNAIVSLVRNLLEVYRIPFPSSNAFSNSNSNSNSNSDSDKQPQKISLVDLHGHRSDVRCVSLSADGRTIATCSTDGLKVKFNIIHYYLYHFNYKSLLALECFISVLYSFV